jgi:prolyl 4-hydroxylase
LHFPVLFHLYDGTVIVWLIAIMIRKVIPRQFGSCNRPAERSIVSASRSKKAGEYLKPKRAHAHARPTMRRSLGRVLLSFLILLSTITVYHAEKSEDMTCKADDGTCESESGSGNQKDAVHLEEEEEDANVQFKVSVVNKSKFRADVYYDDGRYGTNIVTVDANGGEGRMNTRKGHRFFVTRHGVKEGLFDPKTDEQHRFVASKPGETFVIPETAAPSPNLCQDRFSICKSEADRGICFENPGWMIVHCCRSCDKDLNASKIIDPKIRCTRDSLNVTKPAWTPGDLNKLFSSWATDERFAKYEPVVLSSPDDGAHGGKSGPWVMIFDNFLTDKEADALIHGGALVGFQRSTNQGTKNSMGEQESVVSTTRTSSNAWCTGKCEALQHVKSITQKIEEVTGVPRTNYESFQILEYDNDQFYRMHHDSTGRDTTPSGPRIMTFFLYLSDVEEGGETYFNNLDLAVKPKKGRALVWPSVRDDEPDFWDDRMFHEAKAVVKGKKHAANHWIHLYDYQTPNKWGCTGSFG